MFCSSLHNTNGVWTMEISSVEINTKPLIFFFPCAEAERLTFSLSAIKQRLRTSFSGEK